MPIIPDEGFDRPPENLICLICGREVGLAGPQFCTLHLPQYEARQRTGVTTDELSVQWEDSLDNWRERPPELDAETGVRSHSTPFRFEERDGEWILFIRSYEGFRQPDCLAINLRTREVRRFVEASPEDILDDLHGTRPAPHQAQLAARWGNSETTGLLAQLEQLLRGGQPQISISLLMQAMPFPVYGLVGNPQDLAVCSVSREYAGHRLTDVGLTFSSPRYPGVRENLELSSHDAKDQSVIYQPMGQGEPPFWQGECTIDGRKFTGEIRRWAFPQEVAQQLPPGYSQGGTAMFYLKGEETVLSGLVRGPSVEELSGLLQNLVVLNNRADLLEQYQRELDQESKRLFGE